MVFNIPKDLVTQDDLETAATLRHPRNAAHISTRIGSMSNLYFLEGLNKRRSLLDAGYKLKEFQGNRLTHYMTDQGKRKKLGDLIKGLEYSEQQLSRPSDENFSISFYEGLG